MKRCKRVLGMAILLVSMISLYGCSGENKRTDATQELAVSKDLSREDEMVAEEMSDQEIMSGKLSSPASKLHSADFTAPQPKTTLEYITSKAASPENDGEKKFIRTAYLDLVVKDAVSAIHAIEDVAISHQGFIINSELRTVEAYVGQIRITKDSVLIETSYNIRGELELKVHYTHLDAVLRQIAPLAVTVRSRDITAEEVTFDILENQLAQSRKQEKSKRLNSITGSNKGHRLSDMLSVEESMDRSREQEDKAKLEETKLLDRVDYSTIRITLTEEKSLIKTELQMIEKEPEVYRSSFLWMVLDATTEGWNALLDILVDLISVWPLLLIVAVSAYAVVSYRRRRKKNSQK